ncbi:MAG: methyltransferase domain-containing protein [Actinomycetota bacterium]|nr:methyltransferase domain-containing protein [Actinomycetota bacterium]
MSARDWDAATYDRISGPQQAWAAEQLDRLELAGDEIVLDAGCGSGRVTAELVRRVPRGTVYAVDAAPSMVRHTIQALGDAVTVLCQDLVVLALPEPVDVVFSNATFHWIDDHDALFGALHRNLKPGGRLQAQCGGHGNIAAFRRLADEVAGEEPFAAFFTDWQGPWNYATVTDTEQRLVRAGFDQVSCWMADRPTEPEEPRSFVQTVCLVRHLERLPVDLRDQFIDSVLIRLDDPLVLDYVRLNMSARHA